jgi:hypothetical protein
LEIIFVDSYAASAWPTSAGSLVIVSKSAKEDIHLLHFQCVEIRSRTQTLLRNQIMAARVFTPLDPLALRANLSSAWGTFFTLHILQIHQHLISEINDVVADTAWRYSTLTAWGEASAARELSLEMKVPVRTIQTRLRIARDRGILISPGSGSRLGR